MINHINKGKNLGQVIKNAGYDMGAIFDNSVATWYATDSGGDQSEVIDIAVQAIIDSYDPLPDSQSEAIDLIKEKANELILARVPLWKQNNLQAESLSIVAKPSRGQGSLSQADLDRLDEIEAVNVYPLAIRAQSDIDEAAILAQTDWTLCVPDFAAMEAIV